MMIVVRIPIKTKIALIGIVPSSSWSSVGGGVDVGVALFSASIANSLLFSAKGWSGSMAIALS